MKYSHKNLTLSKLENYFHFTYFFYRAVILYFGCLVLYENLLCALVSRSPNPSLAFASQTALKMYGLNSKVSIHF